MATKTTRSQTRAQTTRSTTTTKSQQQKLFNYLRRNRKITAKQAEKMFGTKNLRARITNLREQGWEIESVRNPRNPRTVTYVVNAFM
jgi:predicted HTH transcriptional regulator